jgi:hypothetical protein
MSDTQSASCASTSVTTMAALIAGCTHKRRSGHAGCRRYGRRQRARCAACRSSADYTTNTPSLPERHTTYRLNLPATQWARSRPVAMNMAEPASLPQLCTRAADFRWGAVDYANPCQPPLVRALTASQSLHTPHGIIAAYSMPKMAFETPTAPKSRLRALWSKPLAACPGWRTPRETA